MSGGRGGWTWYTGSAGWMQRAGIESILGLRVQGEFLRLDPCIPKGGPSFEMTVRYGAARYEIRVENPNGVSGGVLSATLDGTAVTGRPLRLRLLDDARVHHIRVTLGMLAVLGTERGMVCGNPPARSENKGWIGGQTSVHYGTTGRSPAAARRRVVWAI